MTKAEVRRLIRSRLAALSVKEKARQASAVAQKVIASDAWRSAAVVMLYLHLPDELATTALIEAARAAGKTIAMPKIIDADHGQMIAARYDGDVKPAPWGLCEPDGEAAVESATIDLILVPGVAFTQGGHRLGRGKGFYDRFLSRAEVRARRVGIAFEEQLVDSLPTDEHDVMLDVVVTSSGRG